MRCVCVCVYICVCVCVCVAEVRHWHMKSFNDLDRENIGPPQGLEPTTFNKLGQCSYQLNYCGSLGSRGLNE